MADQITDQRSLVDSADSTTGWVVAVAGGGSSVALDTDVKIQNTGSIAEQISSARRGCLYNAGATQDWSDQHFYVWINCGIVGLLDLKANGGFTIRFTGPTVTDFFEFYVGGSDSWPVAVEGGWVQFVVDIEATPSNTGGTPPLTTAIQHVGYTAITSGTMTKSVDNTWIDEIRRLPDGTAGIRVEGKNGGTTAWTWADLPTELGSAVGTARVGDAGTVVLNAPVEFFQDDATDHAFLSTNETVLWASQEFAAADLYGITVLGAATGTADWTMGVKTGTGTDATGSQGGAIQAGASDVRWSFDASAANVDSVELYGVQLAHGGAFALDQANAEVISTTFLDCDSADVTGIGTFQRNAIVDANTADGVAFITTDDITDVAFCSFFFSDGHGLEITSGGPSTQISQGNLFVGYGGTPGSNPTASSGSTDAAVYNNAAAARTISVTSGGDQPSVRNGASATTVVEANVSVTLSGMRDLTEVRVLDNATKEFLAGIEDVTDGTVDDRSFTFALGSGTTVDIAIFNVSYVLPPNNRIEDFVIPSSDTTIPVQQIQDRNVI